MDIEKKRVRLDEVTLMRAILALMIVCMHSFTCFNGGWASPAGYVDVPLYKWTARITFAFTLETFVFISGYLFAFQRISLNRKESGWKLIINKLKRLILPSVIFSLLYYVIFYKYEGIGNTIYAIVNGCGHMWFLPMLFWCFVGGWLLEQVKIKDCWKMVILIALNLLSYINLPMRLTNACTFLVYFYGGFLFYKYSDRIKVLVTPRNLVISWVVFFALFAVLRPLRDVLIADDTCSRVQKLSLFVGNSACQLLYAWSGLIAFFATAVHYTQHHQLSMSTIKVASCCFGIYLFQQFILQLLYYKTDFPLWVGPYWLPWCGFVVATVASLVLSLLFLKTKTGRFLIG